MVASRQTRKAGRSVASHKTTMKNMTVPKHAATMKGIYGWYVAMYEKLGWMVLAKAKGYDYKISAYKKSIAHLEKTVEHVMSEYESANRKHDLNVIHMHVQVLKNFVMKHF